MGDYVAVEDLPALDAKKWVRICAVEGLADDEGLRLPSIPPVSVFASEGRLYCIDDTCTHEEFSLAEGWVENGVVECSLHMAKFCLSTGQVICPPAPEPVAVHPVARVGDQIYVALPSTYLVRDGL